MHRRVPYLGDCSADGRWPPLQRNTHPVGVDDHIDPSRSAFVGGFGFWKCQRFCRLSKMRACIAGGHVLAHVRRAASPSGSHAPLQARACVGASIARPQQGPTITQRRCKSATHPGTNLHRRVVFCNRDLGQAMLVPAGANGRRRIFAGAQGI